MNLFEFNQYRDYLQKFLHLSHNKGHGLRGIWAKEMGCQIAYVSHVLNGKNNLSLEQAEALSRHLGHSKEETEYFILLVEKERAGTVSLKKFFQNQINLKLNQREEVRSRMKINESLSVEDQAIYYSKWHYSAIHMALTIPDYQTAQSLSAYFNLDLSVVNECLHFLESKALIKLIGKKFQVVGAFLHLNRNSPLFYGQQIFYRHKAIESIYKNRNEDIHFSSLFSISENDVKKIQSVFLDAIEKSTQIIKPSKEEKLYSINLDLFEFK